MTKNYWVKAAIYRKCQVELEVDAKSSDAQIVSELSIEVETRNTLCDNDRILARYLNDFKKLRHDLDLIQTLNESSKELKVIS